MQTVHPGIVITDPSQCNNVIVMATANTRKSKLIADFKQIILELSNETKNCSIDLIFQIVENSPNHVT